MTDSNIQLGVLTNIQLSDSTNLRALIKGQNSDEVHLSQNSLSNKLELDKLVNGELVFFNTVVRKSDNEDRLEATYCSPTQPARLLEYLLALDTPFSKQSSPPFRRALLYELEKLIAKATDPQVKARLKSIEREFLPQEVVSPAAPTPAISTPQPDSTAYSFKDSTFLRHIFTANPPDYASRLFPLLVEGIRAISDDDSFQQALFLLEFNDQLTEGKILDLQNAFYMLAAPAYRFQFWLRGLVPYCDTEILLAKYANGNEVVKKQVLERCQGDVSALLTATTAPVSSPVIQAYFQDIQAALLEQLSVAQATIRVAVAWFTHEELFDILCEKQGGGIAVELIINNDYINNGEYGLQFEKFLELGGKLYLSEYPALMHHKFCLIDEAVLFTGSYNWTYYAALYNKENVLRVSNSHEVLVDFIAEFERLKQQIGSPVVTVPRFAADEIDRFESSSSRSYLSKDIHSRVAYTRKSRPLVDSQRLAKLLKKAIELDDQNTEAQQLLPHITTDTYAVRAQQAVGQHSAALGSTQLEQVVSPPAGSLLPALSPPPARPVAPSDPATPLAVPAPTAPLPANSPPPTSQSAATTGTSGRSAAIPLPAATSGLGIGAAVAASTKPDTAPAKVTPSLSASTPDARRTAGRYENLQIVFALDYSNSMESHNGGGYKLYSTGKIQQVINMLFGIAKGLTTIEKIDMFLFEDKVIPLPEITEKNYNSYVQDEVLTYPMKGTNIYAPIQDIHEKYLVQSTDKTNVFVILITDGENSNKENNGRIKEYFAAHYDTPIFWQFVGIGAQKFVFLETVVAATPNADFLSLSDAQLISDDTLLERLLQKFPQWFAKL